jgi:hypothetical protein
MATNSTESVLANAKKALESANKFTSNVEGRKPSMFAPKGEAKAASSDYSHARSARKEAGHEFMGVRSDQAPELNAALKSREDARKALEQ